MEKEHILVQDESDLTDVVLPFVTVMVDGFVGATVGAGVFVGCDATVGCGAFVGAGVGVLAGIIFAILCFSSSPHFVQVRCFSPAFVTVASRTTCHSLHECPVAGIVFCSTNTSSHTEQWLPSIFPGFVQVAETILSITILCPVAGISSTLLSLHLGRT